MNTEGLEYYLNLIDEAERVVSGDSLSELIPPCRYRLSEIVKAEPAEPAETVETPPRTGRRSLLLASYQNCHACQAWQRRKYAPPFEGSLTPKVLFVTDRILPDGIYLDREEKKTFESWISHIGLKSSDCAYTSVIKCPGDSFEIQDACERLLKEQIGILDPACVVFLGAAGAFISSGSDDIRYARTHVKTYASKPAFATYPPSDILADASLKRPFWDDLKRVRPFVPVK